MLRATLLTAALAIAGGSLASVAPAATIPIGKTPPSIGEQATSNIHPIAQGRWSYDPRRHGLRYRYRHGPYIYNYGGWFYPRPWWYAPSLGLDIGTGYYYAFDGSYRDDYSLPAAEIFYHDHVQWCFDHYRSYDPLSNSFLGYDGEYHRCDSPFD